MHRGPLGWSCRGGTFKRVCREPSGVTRLPLSVPLLLVSGPPSTNGVVGVTEDVVGHSCVWTKSRFGPTHESPRFHLYDGLF